MKKTVFQNLENRMVTGDPGQNRTGDLPLRSYFIGLQPLIHVYFVCIF